jgi:bla regulator protein BlaR1
LKKIHPYIVDAQLTKNNETKDYQSTLLQNALAFDHLSLSHPFYKSSILRNRIIRLQKSKSTPASILKIAIVIPFLSTNVLDTSCNPDEAEQIKETILIEEIKNSDQAFILESDTDLPFAKINEALILRNARVQMQK